MLFYGPWYKNDNLILNFKLECYQNNGYLNVMFDGSRKYRGIDVLNVELWSQNFGPLYHQMGTHLVVLNISCKTSTDRITPLNVNDF